MLGSAIAANSASAASGASASESDSNPRKLKGYVNTYSNSSSSPPGVNGTSFNEQLRVVITKRMHYRRRYPNTASCSTPHPAPAPPAASAPPATPGSVDGLPVCAFAPRVPHRLVDGQDQARRLARGADGVDLHERGLPDESLVRVDDAAGVDVDAKVNACEQNNTSGQSNCPYGNNQK